MAKSGKSGEKWRKVAKSDGKKSGEKVTKSDEKWRKVVESGEK